MAQQLESGLRMQILLSLFGPTGQVNQWKSDKLGFDLICLTFTSLVGPGKRYIFDEMSLSFDF